MMTNNQKGEKILTVLHVLIAVVLLVYFAMGAFGVWMLWDVQPNLMARVTTLIAFVFTTIGLGYILSWVASWALGWFQCGMIQNAKWRNLRATVAGIIATLVGISCITSAVAWALER